VQLAGQAEPEIPFSHTDPQKRELLGELHRLFQVSGDSPFGHRTVMESGQALLVTDVEPGHFQRIAASAEQLALLEASHCESWLVVPLRIQQHVFGTMTLAYAGSHRHYAQRDLVLASELARRAAVALDNARLYEQSQHERSRVEAATRAKDEFVAMVSHELRTPLTAILGWTRLIRSGSLDEGRLRQAFDVIERNAQAQSRLVGDLLDVSRAITGNIRLNPTQVELSNVVDMAVEAVRPAAEAKRVHIDVDVEREHALVRCDGDRMQQVVWNLLVNAVKFTPKEGTVRVRLRRLESEMELTVTDNGEGISAEFLPHVFETFRQAEAGASRAHSGLGIGLSIVKHLVELHGGSIEAHSPGLGEGATFVVRLPIGPLVPETASLPRVPATKGETGVDSMPHRPEGIRVLVVDDEPDARDLLKYVLETSGMEVRLAASASDALKELSASEPHVVVSDLGMPAEDGYALIRGIRMLPDPTKRDIPAIALTAFARNEDRTRALVEGFNLHMSKPVEPAALVNAVRELVGSFE
jgi:signal transduction histidine kinase/CheY-like chemotaxis protein